MSDKEIIKALECCIISSQGEKPCVECPYSIKNTVNNWCYGVLLKDVLALINRQKAEIDDLNKDLADTIALNYEERKGLKAEIERLEAKIFGLQNIRKEALYRIKKYIKAEAKKEFASELIEEIVNTPTKFESSYYMYRQGIAFRQNEIIDIIQRKVGDV